MITSMVACLTVVECRSPYQQQFVVQPVQHLPVYPNQAPGVQVMHYTQHQGYVVPQPVPGMDHTGDNTFSRACSEFYYQPQSQVYQPVQVNPGSLSRGSSFAQVEQLSDASPQYTDWTTFGRAPSVVQHAQPLVLQRTNTASSVYETFGRAPSVVQHAQPLVLQRTNTASSVYETFGRAPSVVQHAQPLVLQPTNTASSVYETFGRAPSVVQYAQPLVLQRTNTASSVYETFGRAPSVVQYTQPLVLQRTNTARSSYMVQKHPVLQPTATFIPACENSIHGPDDNTYTQGSSILCPISTQSSMQSNKSNSRPTSPETLSFPAEDMINPEYSSYQVLKEMDCVPKVHTSLISKKGILSSLSSDKQFHVLNKCPFSVGIVCCTDPNYKVVLSRSGKLGIGVGGGGPWFEISASEQSDLRSNRAPASWQLIPEGQKKDINTSTKKTFVTLTDEHKTCSLGASNIDVRRGQTLEVHPII